MLGIGADGSDSEVFDSVIVQVSKSGDAPAEGVAIGKGSL